MIVETFRILKILNNYYKDLHFEVFKNLSFLVVINEIQEIKKVKT